MKKIKLISGLATIATVGTTFCVLASCSCSHNREVVVDSSVASDVTITTKTNADGDMLITIKAKETGKAISSVTVKIGSTSLHTSQYKFDKTTGVLTIKKAVLDKYQGTITVKPVIEEEQQVEWEEAFEQVDILDNNDANVTITMPGDEANEDTVIQFRDGKGVYTDEEGTTYYKVAHNMWLELASSDGTTYTYQTFDDGAYMSYAFINGVKNSTSHTYDSTKKCYTGSFEYGEFGTLNFEAYFTDNKLSKLVFPSESGDQIMNFTNIGSTTISTFPDDSKITDNVNVATLSSGKYEYTITSAQAKAKYLILFESPSISGPNKIDFSFDTAPTSFFTTYFQSNYLVLTTGSAQASQTFAAGVITKTPLLCEFNLAEGETATNVTITLTC